MGNLYTQYFAHISIKMRVVGNPYTQYFCPYLNKKVSYGQPLHPILCPYLNKKVSYGQNSALFLANIMITSYGSQTNVLAGKCQHQPS